MKVIVGNGRSNFLPSQRPRWIEVDITGSSISAAEKLKFSATEWLLNEVHLTLVNPSLEIIEFIMSRERFCSRITLVQIRDCRLSFVELLALKGLLRLRLMELYHTAPFVVDETEGERVSVAFIELNSV